MTEQRALPPMPAIGRPESYYAKLAHDADKAADIHGHEAAKVGQYITLALDESLTWEEKAKYFQHTIRRHCQGPTYVTDEDIEKYYQRLADLVRQYAGQEALRIASAQDDIYAARLSMGQPREQIEDEAEEFFLKMMGTGDQRPEFLNESDWQQLKLLRDQWI